VVQDSSQRRQSIEEYLRMGLGRSPEKRKVKILSSLDMPAAAAAEVVATKSLPPPPSSSSSTPAPEISKPVSVDAEALNLPPFVGSVDFYEQYDPDVARDMGQALITTEKLPIEWLCFLCGSAGKEDLVFCRTCCEPFHPFCQVSRVQSSAKTLKIFFFKQIS
jgi:histone-lysine N-methyltransferase MLL1